MKSWRKPEFSVLSVNATKGNSYLKIISGVPKLDAENGTEEFIGEESTPGTFGPAEDYEASSIEPACCPSWWHCRD